MLFSSPMKVVNLPAFPRITSISVGPEGDEAGGED